MTLPVIKLAAEGHIDFALLRRLAHMTGFEPGEEYGKRGKPHLDMRLSAYNAAARFEPWLIARDLDQDAPCASELAKELLPEPSHLMRFRVVVRASEAWILADRQAFSDYFRIGPVHVPKNPEMLDNPKRAMLDILLRSQSRETRDATVRVSRDGARYIGAEYNSLLGDFVSVSWRPEQAAKAAPSLARALNRLIELEENL